MGTNTKTSRPARYPVQLVILVDQATADYVNDVAARTNAPKSEVARNLMVDGIKAAQS